MTIKLKKYIFIIPILLLISIFSIYFFTKKENENEEYLTIYGNVDIRQVDLGFRVFGKVETLFFDEGDEVEQGNLLAILDKVPYEEVLDQSKAKLREIEFAASKAEAKFSKRYKIKSGAISKEEYDDAFFNLEEMRANLDQAKASLATALTNLEDTKLFCPTKGTILTRIREPGSVLNPGEPVFTLSIASPVWIRTYVSEPYLGKIYFGMKADVITDTPESKIFHGHIGFISPVAEFTPKNVESLDLRTDLVYRLRVIVDDPNNELKQGMPVTVKLKLKNRDG
ncbi:MAG: hypothetical protein AMS24_01455 [Chlamydiae bacterium SM23_39]|nr:MAG: hypothetical protein AMS24_01455 [Chlamydiae bacterium SM23_39]